MAELPRLNGIIKALEEGGVAFVGSAPADGAAGTNAPYDGALFEMEHGPMTSGRCKEGAAEHAGSPPDRAARRRSGRHPIVRIPPNQGRPTGSPNEFARHRCVRDHLAPRRYGRRSL